jgi:hypothetical protein
VKNVSGISESLGLDKESHQAIAPIYDSATTILPSYRYKSSCLALLIPASDTVEKASTSSARSEHCLVVSGLLLYLKLNQASDREID